MTPIYCYRCDACGVWLPDPPAAWKHSQESGHGWDAMTERHDWDQIGPFVKNSQMWVGEKAHVTCRECGSRTWLSREGLDAAKGIPASGSSPRRLRAGGENG